MVLFRKTPHKHNLSGVEGYILNMYTSPEHRRNGVATKILDALTAVARERNAGLIHVANHGTHHRAETAMALTAMGHPLEADLDYGDFEKERAPA